MKRPFQKKTSAKNTGRSSARTGADRGRTSHSSSFSYYTMQRHHHAASGRQSSSARKGQRDPSHGTTGLAGLLADKPRLEQVLHRFGSVLLASILLICLVSVLQVNTNPRILLLNGDQGFALHSDEEYAAVATNAIRGSMFNTNKVTINTHDISRHIEQAFPEVKSASIALPLIGHRPTVYIELTRPILVLNTASQSVVIDSAGQALVRAQSVANLASFKLPSVYDQSQLNLSVGDVVLSSNAVAFIQEVLAQLSSRQLHIDRMVLPAGTEELDIYLKGDTYYTKYNLHETNARQQVGTFLAVRKKLSKEKGVPSEYIDVRLAGRAYYK